ncbi:hypothetical protein [Salipiger sp. PrR003]|uniref:hypothetical protein n=1 Tax=Salipiger sp. PrR003 TaxID=2706776 RepID=UPI0013DC67D1|nr:hypothetical protein [Salipiger sp. PrR003]NDV53856.1 hypothetical protein [Salipiger sp. PrR003]
MTRTLGDALPAAIHRIREEVLPASQSIWPAGQPAIQLVINPALLEAVDALASGDVVRMARAHQALVDIKV